MIHGQCIEGKIKQQQHTKWIKKMSVLKTFLEE